MTQYISLNVKLSNSQLNKLKSGIQNGTEVTLTLSSNVISNSNDDETNFTHKLLLTNTQISTICKVFANGSSANIKFSKIQLYKVVQSGSSLYDALGITDPFGIVSSLKIRVVDPYKEELKNIDPKELNSDLLVDSGLNIIGKKTKKGFSTITGSGLMLTNNEIKYNIIKVISNQKIEEFY